MTKYYTFIFSSSLKIEHRNSAIRLNVKGSNTLQKSNGDSKKRYIKNSENKIVRKLPFSEFKELKHIDIKSKYPNIKIKLIGGKLTNIKLATSCGEVPDRGK